MLQVIKQKLKNFIKASIHEQNSEVELYRISDRLKWVLPEQKSQIEQIQLINQYVLMKKTLAPADMPSINDVGFSVYSQFEEDGMLLYIFVLIGSGGKKVIEICSGDGSQCMATNLILNHGWDALLFDGDVDSVNRGINYFASHPATFLYPPKFKQAWLTKENINQLISDAGFSGEIDLLSLDIDGNDYHIMEALEVVKPRVILCEVHNVIPPEFALTIPYQPDFCYTDGKHHEEFRSASLLAMKKLLEKKEYRLIAAHKYGFNVFFMRNDLGQEFFPEISVESVYQNGYSKMRMDTAWNAVKNAPWQEIQ